MTNMLAKKIETVREDRFGAGTQLPIHVLFCDAQTVASWRRRL